jgi:hypothetical protein
LGNRKCRVEPMGVMTIMILMNSRKEERRG